MTFSATDKKQLSGLKIKISAVAAQINDLKAGYPYLRIAGAATIGNGILQMRAASILSAINEWKAYCGLGEFKCIDGRVVKFVPASGAASRMFKDLYEFRNSDQLIPVSAEVQRFFDNIGSFAFYDELNVRCVSEKGRSVEDLLLHREYREILSVLLDKEYMSYGNLPKGLLLFHKYPDGVRTACTEHIVEGALYTANADGEVNLHFTVSPEHIVMFKQHIDSILPRYEKQYNVRYNVSMSIQKSSTDTVALDANGNLVRNDDGSILFRPGGHGALIENLNDIDADVVFIKNIDNVVPDRFKSVTVNYKELIAGVLVSNQRRIFDYLRKLDAGDTDDEVIKEMLDFCADVLNIAPGTNELYAAGKYKEYLYKVLDRPIRVCGMVKNEGEPGGGPYLAVNADGTISPQILESSQIDKNNEQSLSFMNKAEYFNPVDLVCGIKNYRGEKFDLTRFVDRNTGFISEKSKNGKSMRVLELPGLWNGAMSDWNTIFVEVPLATFNPVKTVNDLLREQHR